MNILLVDDEMAMIQILKQMVDWNALGIASVFHAYNARDARKLMAEEHIDILICDIEMPKENGLQLIGFVRAAYPDMAVLILTAYPEFDYARQAIEFGVSGYLLKPISSAELGQAVSEVMERLRQTEKERQLKKYAEYKSNNGNEKKQMLKDIYRDLFLEEIEPEEGVIRFQLNKLELPWECVCHLTLILFQTMTPEHNPKERRLKRFILVNVAEELFPEYTVLDMDGDIVFVIMSGQGQLSAVSICSKYMEIAKERLRCRLRAFVLQEVSSVRLSRAWEQLQEYAHYTALEGDDIQFLTNYLYNEDQGELIFDRGKWEALLMEMDKSAIMGQFDKEMKAAMEQKSMGKKYLMRYRQELLKMYLKAKVEYGDTKDAMSAEELPIFESACESTVALRQWVEFKVDAYMQSIDTKKAADVDLVKRYLESHCTEEIKRRDLEDLVHLNKDYLNRIFKAETGYSLMKYVQLCRVELARQYLENTQDSICDIAIRVGYDSPAYFSRIYKKLTGESPQKFRDK